MTGPQVVMGLMICVGLVSAAFDHGKPRRAPQSFWPVLIGAILTVAILWWGGFWRS